MSQAQAFKCPSCSASLDYDGRSETVRCDYCHNTIIVPDSLRQATSRYGTVGDDSPEMGEQIHHILELVQQGNKIEAIKQYRETFGVSLKEAKEAVEHLDHGEPTVINISSSTIGAAGATAAAGSSGCGCILPIIIFLFIGGVVGWVFLQENPDQGDQMLDALMAGDLDQLAVDVEDSIVNINRAARDQPVPLSQGGDQVPVDLLLKTWDYGGSEIGVNLSYTSSDDSGRTVIWETPAGTSGNANYGTAFDRDQVYMTKEASLSAFDRQDGEPLWETVLSDVASYLCPTCLQTADDMVVVLTEDNVLEAFDRRTGRSAWQVRLRDENFIRPDTGAYAYVIMNGQVGITDDIEVDGRNETALHWYDLKTGELTQEMRPSCSDVAQFFPDDYLDHNSQIIFDESTNEVVFLFGTSFVGQLCFQKWVLGQNEPVWATRLPEDLDFDTSAEAGLYPKGTFSPYLVAEGDTFLTTMRFTGGNSMVFKFDLTNGALVDQFSGEDYDVFPIGEVDGRMLLRASRLRGTDQIEIWGVDPLSANPFWQVPLAAEYLFEEDPFDDRYSYRLYPDGVVVLELFTDPDPAELTVQKLNINSGQPIYKVENQLAEDSWRGLSWTNDFAYLTTGDLVAVDLETGTAEVEWP